MSKSLLGCAKQEHLDFDRRKAPSVDDRFRHFLESSTGGRMGAVSLESTFLPKAVVRGGNWACVPRVIRWSIRAFRHQVSKTTRQPVEFE